MKEPKQFKGLMMAEWKRERSNGELYLKLIIKNNVIEKIKKNTNLKFKK